MTDSKATVGNGNAAFAFLDQTHREIDAKLLRLKALADAMRDDGLTAEVRAETAEVRAWLDTNARQHHLDEERHIFPPLLASHDAELAHTARQLTQDHGWIEQNWLEIEPSLSAAEAGNSWFDMDVLYQQIQLFLELYNDHMVLEESVAYPAASPLISGLDGQQMRAEMEQRRQKREAAAAE